MAKRAVIKPEFDMEAWREVKEIAAGMKSLDGDLKDFQKECEDAYFMEHDLPADDNLKVTVSPDPHNKINGAIRLLTATSPHFEVPKGTNDTEAEQMSGEMEEFANTAWARSNTEQQMKVERELAFTAFMHDQIQAEVVSTQDLVKQIKEHKGQASKAGDKYHEAMADRQLEAAELTAETTPFLFTPLLPTSGWSLKTRGKVNYYYSFTEVRAGTLLATWGEAARRLIGDKYHPWDKLNLHSAWDLVNRYYWLDEGEEPLYAAPHGMKEIPIVDITPEGAQLYTDPMKSHKPFLYPILKSGIYKRQNLFWTVLMTNLAGMLNAQFVLEQGSDDADVSLDFRSIGGVVKVPPGSKLGPLMKSIVTADVMQLWQALDGKMEESTIYGQALGERISGQAAFSMVALLAQQGRLPLVPVQEALSLACSKLMSIALQMFKDNSAAGKVHTDTGKIVELNAMDIPAHVQFKVMVDVDLPQDRLQATNIALQATSGPDPLMPKSWARTNILKAPQSDKLQQEIWAEQMSGEMVKIMFQEFIKMQMQGPPTDPNAPNAAAGQAGKNPPGNPQEQGGGQVDPRIAAAQKMQNTSGSGIPQPPEVMPPEMQEGGA